MIQSYQQKYEYASAIQWNEVMNCLEWEFKEIIYPLALGDDTPFF